MITLRYLLIYLVEHRLSLGVFYRTSLKIVLNQQAGHLAEVVACVDMVVNLVLQLHIVTGFSESEAVAWRNGNKPICFDTSPVTGSWLSRVAHTQSTFMASPGLCWICIVAFVALAHCRYFSQYWVYI